MVILAMWALQSIGEFILPSHYQFVDPIAFLTDLVGTVGFGIIALHARRIWPLWATALQLLSLSAHFARWADLAIPRIVYALMRDGPTFIVMIVLLGGTILHIRRMHRGVTDNAWQNWSKRSAGSGR